MNKPTMIVIGNGMVGQKFLEAIKSLELTLKWNVVVFGGEFHRAYDRVALSSYVRGKTPQDLFLAEEHFYNDFTFYPSDPVERIDRDQRLVYSSSGLVQDYDTLVLATGSKPFVPPVSGAQTKGCFVYRTFADLDALRIASASAKSGLVVGGGLLGLEAADALSIFGLETHLVEMAPRLLPLQVDEAGGNVLRRHVESLGFQLHLSTSIQSVEADASGAVNGAILANSERIEAQVIVFATGVRPDDALARSAGLTMGARGGIEVNSQCRTSDDRIFAIGECASIDGRCFGLVAPGYAMAEVVAQHLAGHEAAFVSGDLSTKLKLLGVEVASFGDAFGATPGALDVVYVDQVQGIYKKLVLSDDARTLLGGILVGDASSYPMLRSMASSQQALEADPEQYLMVASKGPIGAMTLSDSANVCACQNVDAGTIRTCIVRDNAFELSVIKTTTLAGTGCGSCLPLVKDILKEQLLAQGKEVSKALCEHFKYSRQELFDLVRVEGIKTFSLLIERHGSARGCDICKPAVASILATAFGAHPLDNEFAAIQDTNDHLLANIQRNGSYSVVPRIPGGEITPEGLIAIGEVAKEFGLYTKITGAQRIDLLGARAEQLPAVWERLVTAGFESGHAYGKSLRTVKSCVGSTWCRYGVQDSVSMAIGLELRYRGLRSPHKLKFGVSGCARECAEARGKDVGVIATERGWNLYVGGNGGFTPRHAQLLVSDIDSETLIRYIDRFLMYYIRTADRLQRTAPWIESLDGGLAHVKEVVVEDSLGLSSELEAAMALHIDNYVDEWKMVLEDPKKLSYFNSFVNDPTKADPSIEFVTERSQPRPIPIDLNRDKRKVSPSTMAKDDASNWVTICHHSELIPERPVAALLDDNQVAVVMLADGTIHAIENLDPFSGANVLARGLVGNKGDRPVIISPMYKQAFDLTNGHCLEDDSVRLAIHPVRVINGRVEVCR